MCRYQCPEGGSGWKPGEVWDFAARRLSGQIGTVIGLQNHPSPAAQASDSPGGRVKS